MKDYFLQDHNYGSELSEIKFYVVYCSANGETLSADPLECVFTILKNASFSQIYSKSSL